MSSPRISSSVIFSSYHPSRAELDGEKGFHIFRDIEVGPGGREEERS